MKRKAINLYALRLLSLLIALSLVLGGGALTVSADDDRYTQWEYDPATDTLTALYPNGSSDSFAQIGIVVVVVVDGGHIADAVGPLTDLGKAV
jgi:hypothetical protein